MPYAVRSEDLAEFQQLLIGTWENPTDNELIDHNGKPLSYNVMPLPQIDPMPGRPSTPPNYGGFILKNFTFTERIRFNGSAIAADPPNQQDPGALAVVAGAPNRGGTYTQFVHAVFYDQQVHFAEGPDNGKIVHVENGAWLHLGSQEQSLGPYDVPSATPIPSGQVLRQPAYITIAKQIAVPHGNSVLALGNIDLNDEGHFYDDLKDLHPNTVFRGRPTIPDAFVPYPISSDIATPNFFNPYDVPLNAANDYENPNEVWTLNPNYPLQLALNIINPKAFMHWRVTTLPLFGGKGVVTNVPFEQRKANVTQYWADYWLLSRDEYRDMDQIHEKPHVRRRRMTFDYLLYTQTALMEMQISIDGGATYKTYTFPHVTSNAVKKVPGTPTVARAHTQTPLE